jgi:hypothetical protein
MRVQLAGLTAGALGRGIPTRSWRLPVATFTLAFSPVWDCFRRKSGRKRISKAIALVIHREKGGRIAQCARRCRRNVGCRTPATAAYRCR